MVLDLSKFDWSTPTAAASAQLRTSGGASRDIPAYVPPAPTPAPAPKPASNNTRSSSGGYQVGGWYDGRQWDGSRLGNPGEVIVGGSGSNQQISSGPSIDQQFLDEINNQYNNTINFLNQQEGNINNEYKSSVDLTNRSYDQARTQSQEGYQQNVLALDDNKTELETSKRSALSDAVRAYNALAQQRIARFGGGSSAGQAVGELAQQEYFRQTGGIEQTYLSQAREIQRSRENINLIQKQYEDNLNLERDAALAEIKKELDNRLATIQMSKAEAESGKAQMRLSVIQQSIDRARSIQDYFSQRGAAIRESVLEKQAELSGRYDNLLALADQYEAGNYYSPFTQNQFAGSDLSQRSQGTTPAYKFNPYSRDDDEENPFFSA